MTAHQLRMIAFHVQTLAQMEEGEVVTISPTATLTVKAECGDTGEVHLNGRWVGSRNGAVQEYARLVAADLGLTD